MIEELDQVVLDVDLPEHHLKAGDIGVVVLIHGDHVGYSLEFVTLEGETVAVISVYAHQVRPIESGEIAHVRKLPSA
jgi:hypothetical protein